MKQLLGKTITDKEIRQLYPSGLTDNEFKNYLERTREELADPEIILYCCAECGDYYCGGIKVKIEKNDSAFIWIITEDDKQLTFKFDKYQYFNLFNSYLRDLEMKH